MRELVPGIVCWSWFSAPHGYDFNGTLVRHPGGNLCIDPVPATDGDLAALLRDGVAQIVLTNRNHLRDANNVRTRTGAPVLIHPADAAYARGQGGTIDGDLRPGSRVGPFDVLGVPGKSPGEVALHWPERRLLVVGDAVIGNPPGHLTLLRERVVDDMRRLRASVRALVDLEVETLVLGDGVSVVGAATAELRRLVATFPE